MAMVSQDSQATIVKRIVMDKLQSWNYGSTPAFPYGDETTYKKAMAFLDGPWIIEDWGCGTAWAKKFVMRGRYIGIDGSWSMHCDMIADLRTYKSGSAGGILMRHILEHNFDWKQVLENALASFQKKFVLILFTPFTDTTKVIAMNKVGGASEATVPDLAFCKQDLLDLISKYKFTEESLQTATQYGQEHIFYIEK
jgi:hypothetical protein